jgi:hypothetical protein
VVIISERNGFFKGIFVGRVFFVQNVEDRFVVVPDGVVLFGFIFVGHFSDHENGIRRIETSNSEIIKLRHNR